MVIKYKKAKRNIIAIWERFISFPCIKFLIFSAWKLGNKNNIPSPTNPINWLLFCFAYSTSAYPLCAIMYTESVKNVATPLDKNIENKIIKERIIRCFIKIPKIARKIIEEIEAFKNKARLMRNNNCKKIARTKIKANPRNFQRIILDREMGRESVR